MPKRVRPIVDQQPKWDKRFKGWATRFILENMWRVECYGTTKEKLDDLLQDAYLVFRNVLATYPVETRGNVIMGLFKTSMRNDYKDKSRAWTEKRNAEIPEDTLLAEDLKIIDTLGEENNEGLLKILISEWPPELQAALAVLNDEVKMIEIRRPPKLSRLAQLAGMDPKKETLNEAISRIIRLPKTADLLGMIKSALTKSEEVK